MVYTERGSGEVLLLDGTGFNGEETPGLDLFAHRLGGLGLVCRRRLLQELLEQLGNVVRRSGLLKLTGVVGRDGQIRHTLVIRALR